MDREPFADAAVELFAKVWRGTLVQKQITIAKNPGTNLCLHQRPPPPFERIKKMRKICPASPAGGPSCIIEANGGMNKETAKKAVEAGANIIVAAKAIFGAEDIKKAIEELKTISNI